MIKEHPNLKLLSKLNILDLNSSAELFSDDFVWHYFNPNLPDVEGDYFGLEGLKKFFAIIAKRTEGTFKVAMISANPIGDELIIVHAQDSMKFEGNSFTIDVAILWRIVDGKITEAWDIPSAYTFVNKAEG